MGWGTQQQEARLTDVCPLLNPWEPVYVQQRQLSWGTHLTDGCRQRSIAAMMDYEALSQHLCKGG